jgi:hypothetical protein
VTVGSFECRDKVVLEGKAVSKGADKTLPKSKRVERVYFIIIVYRQPGRIYVCGFYKEKNGKKEENCVILLYFFFFFLPCVSV